MPPFPTSIDPLASIGPSCWRHELWSDLWSETPQGRPSRTTGPHKERHNNPKTARNLRGQVLHSDKAPPDAMAWLLVPTSNRIHPPIARNALELMGATILEADPGAGHQVFDRARNQYLSWLREGRDAGARMHCDPCHFAVHQLAFPRVQAGAHLQSELRHGLDNRARTPDGPRRSVEGSEESVAGGIHLAAAEPHKLGADELVVALQELTPSAVAERGRFLARADDVGEKHRGEHAVSLGPLPPGFPGVGQELLDRAHV